jgi:hypothetical protein
MGVVVERRNLFDLRQQALVDSLDIGSGKRACLGRAPATDGDETADSNCNSHGSRSKLQLEFWGSWFNQPPLSPATPQILFGLHECPWAPSREVEP